MMASMDSKPDPEEDSSSPSLRTCLPFTQPDKSGISLWSYLKRCVGKELTKISMPVQWNEPLSLLQRVSEYMSYSHLLQAAAGGNDVEQRMLWIASFAVSALSDNYERLGKPFNPLLGETFQLEMPHFRMLCEQVGHHPPVTAFHASDPEDGKQFVFRGSMYPKVKFWGKCIEFQPKGTCTVQLAKHDETYTWSNVNCVIHNIIIGSLRMEQQGIMEITNHTTKHKCVLNFKPGGWFSSQDDLHVVEGFLLDPSGQKKAFLYGKWTDFLCSVDLDSVQDYLNVKLDKVDANGSNMPKHAPLKIAEVPNSTVLWQAEPRPENSRLYYNFSQFAMGLNDLSPLKKSKKKLCPTDSRLRPDIRALENGQLDLAVLEKERLEIKQREYRSQYKNMKECDWWKPRWFASQKNEFSMEDDWVFVGHYWNNRDNFANSLDIF